MESLKAVLKEHLLVCQEILALAEREHQTLRSPEQSSQFNACQTRNSVLPRLSHRASEIRRHREAWQRLPASERNRDPEVASLIRDNQDLIMRILMLDRENQQLLLKRGLVPPQHIPPAQGQKPHFVADLYRRNGVGLAHAD